MTTLSRWGRGARFGLLALLACAFCVSLTACGGDPAPTVAPVAPTVSTSGNTPAPPSDTKKEGQHVGVILSEWAIIPAGVSIPAGKVTFDVTNKGVATHNLVIQSASGDLGKTPNFTKDQGVQELTIDLQPGTYKMICTIPTHADKGMVGTLTVTK